MVSEACTTTKRSHKRKQRELAALSSSVRCRGEEVEARGTKQESSKTQRGRGSEWPVEVGRKRSFGEVEEDKRRFPDFLDVVDFSNPRNGFSTPQTTATEVAWLVLSRSAPLYEISAFQTTLFDCKSTISSSPNPSSRNTSTECCLNTGGGRVS